MCPRLDPEGPRGVVGDGEQGLALLQHDTAFAGGEPHAQARVGVQLYAGAVVEGDGPPAPDLGLVDAPVRQPEKKGDGDRRRGDKRQRGRDEALGFRAARPGL